MIDQQSLTAEIDAERISPWHLVDQRFINMFADATGDHQYIHVDPDRARETFFGSTIAHGLLTLSLLPVLAHECLPQIPKLVMSINYGYDKVRFAAPVPVDSRIRARFTLGDFRKRGDDEVLCKYDVQVDIDGVEKPAIVAQWLRLLKF